MSDHRTTCGARLFNVIAETTRLLRLAHDKRLQWRWEINQGTDTDGSLVDEYAIRITIGPGLDPDDPESPHCALPPPDAVIPAP
jgi:hypothetical protein